MKPLAKCQVHSCDPLYLYPPLSSTSHPGAAAAGAEAAAGFRAGGSGHRAAAAGSEAERPAGTGETALGVRFTEPASLPHLCLMVGEGEVGGKG